MANQVDFKILPSDQFNVYSPQTRSEKVITYFTLLSKLRGDILAVSSQDDPNSIISAYYTNVGNTQTLHLVKADGSEVTASNSFAGTVTSVDMSVPTGFAISGNPITTSGILNVSFASGYSLPTNALQATWTTAYNRSITSAAVTGTSTKTLTLNQQDGGTVTASWTDQGLTSVGLTMPAAFNVANSPLTSNGTIAVTAAGLSSQYIRGDGQLANFPSAGGGGSAVNYYLNGSVNQGTFGGTTYYQMSRTPISGTGTNFTRTSAQGNGYVASFITDAGDPDLLNIPGGNWNLEFYFNSSSSGGAPAFYGELYKVSASNVFTLISSGSTNTEVISGGTTIDQYYTSIAVPQTTLLSTDRLAIRVYVIVDGRNITLHTEDNNFSEVITTFSTGLNALNGLTDQVQYFATGTSGTDFNIVSATDTHTFNIPTASGTNRGLLSSSDWTTFNSKASDSFKTIAVTGQSNVVADSATDTLTFEAGTNIVITTDAATDKITISAVGGGSGSVTNVDMTVPTGFAISGNPITTSGTLALAFASGYSLPTNASQTNWNTAYDNSITSFAYNTSTGVLTLTQQDAGTLTATVTLQPFTTTNLAEGTNLYFTTARARQSLSAGTGINYDNSTGVITNSAPDQIVSLTGGTGISTSGTYPSFTITNTAPDQTVVLTAGAGITTSGTYPNFTITNSDRGSSQNIFKNIAVAGQSTIVADSNDDTLTVASGTGISLATNATSDTLTITNTAPDQTVVLNAGTGISTSGTYPNFTITNTAPDQIVSLTGAGTTVVTGTYPSFTITSNDQYVGTVTSVATSAPITGGTITSSGTIGITKSTTSSDGYLSSTDWNTFNSKIGGSGTTNYVAKFTGSSAVGNSSIYDNGNVGINTTSPQALLHVQGTGLMTTFRNGSAGADEYSQLEFVAGSRTAYIWLGNQNTTSWAGAGGLNIYTANGNMDFWTSGVQRVRIDTSGNLGIGTMNPQGPLEVYRANTGGLGGHIILNNNGFAVGNETAILFNDSGVGSTSFVRAAISSTVEGSPFFGDIKFKTGVSTYGSLSTRMIITGAGNVGIGTTAPANKLDVRGIARVLSDDSITSKILHYTPSPYGMVFRAYGSGANSIQVQREANDAELFPLVLQPNGSNVGIGTTIPGSLLQVGNAGAAPTGLATLTLTGANTAPQIATKPGLYHRHNVGLGVFSDYAISFQVNGFSALSDAMYITNTGNVGIGTTAPTSKLYIEGGSANWNETTPGLSVGTIHLDPGTDTNDYGNAITFGASDAVGGTNAQAGIYLRSDGNYGTKMYFATTDSYAAGSKTRMFIGHDGNVGIGTTAPGYKLEVAGNIWAVDYFIQNSAGTGGTFRLDGYQDYLYFYGDSAAIAGYRFGSDTAGIKMQIGTNGNVGIGTASPLFNLQVGANSGTIATTTIRLQNSYLDSNGYYGFNIDAVDNGVNGHDLRFLGRTSPTGAFSEVVRIKNSGNVGIGTTAPASKLNVAGGNVTVSAGYGIAWSGDQSRIMTPEDNVSGALIQYGSGAIMRFVNGTTEHVRINGSGNVGIGTTSPNAKLDVAGGINTRNTRVNSAEKYPVGHYSFGETVFEIDPTWTEAQLQDFFNVSGVSWVADSTAPGGYAIQIDGSANVGAGEYDSGFPYIPVDNSQDDWYYMECYIRNDAGSSIQHYMGGIDFNQNFASLGGNPGSYTYNVMFNYNPGTSWTKVYGYWNGFGSSYGSAGTGNTNNWVSGTKYFTPQALFNYGLNSGIRRCYISGWKCVRVRATGNRYYSNNVLVSGNVGVGTTAPDAKLVVTGDGGGTVKIGSAGFGGNYTGISLNGTLNTVSYNFLSSTSDTHLYINRPTGNDIYFRLANNDQAVIKASGNVGIGTSAPSHKLQVAGGIASTFGSTNGYIALQAGGSTVQGYIEWFKPNPTRVAYMGYNDGVSANNLGLTLENSANFVINGGNVGIGTTAPGAKLQINDGTGSAEFLRLSVAYDTSRSARGGIYWHDTANTTGRIYTEYDGTMTSMVFGSLYNSGYNSNNLMIIRGNGNVGIGTTSPGYKLDVSGTIRATGDVIAYSDARVKENVETLDGALDKVMKMRGVSYNKIGEQEKKVGVIAQEILEVLPEVVSQDETGTYSVAYGNIVSVLIEAIKEQQKQIDELKAKLK